MKLSSMSNSQLVDMFEDLGIAESEACASLETAKVIRLIKRRWAVGRELRYRPEDARRALFVLYDHDNPQVQLNAATATYALDPVKARNALEKLAASRFLPWSGYAGMSLAMLDDGTSQLPNDPDL